MRYSSIEDNKIIGIIYDDDNKVFDIYTWKDFVKVSIDFKLFDYDFLLDNDYELDLVPCLERYKKTLEDSISFSNHVDYMSVSFLDGNYLFCFNTWASNQGGILIVWDILSKEPILVTNIEYLINILPVLNYNKLILSCLVSNFITPPKPYIYILPLKQNISEDDKIQLTIDWNLSNEEIEYLESKIQEKDLFKTYIIEKKDMVYFYFNNFRGKILSKDFYDSLESCFNKRS